MGTEGDKGILGSKSKILIGVGIPAVVAVVFLSTI